MKVLIIGSGGREAALAWKIAGSPLTTQVMVAPGNPGLKGLSPKISLHQLSSFEDYLPLKPDLVIIGPEAPLSEGVVDFLEKHYVPVVGPTQAASRLESSKIFCKEIFSLASIPTARYSVVSDQTEAEDAMKDWKYSGVVVKVDGLAQGKGVIVCDNKEQALKATKEFFDGSYLGVKTGDLLLEERLEGEEVSAFALCDGENFVYMGSATDYKRLNDADQGPNTGGMGTISPSPVLKAEDEQWIQQKIFAPALKAMKAKGTPFKGFLFAGLMKTKNGFFALEFNTRMGDPETQSLLPRISSDLVPLLMKAARGQLQNETLVTSGVAIHVVFSAAGYPGVGGEGIKKGDVINHSGLNANTLYFPAAIAQSGNNFVTNGGRVCGLTVLGESLKAVYESIYQEVKKVSFNGIHFRKDIGKKFL